MRVCGKNVFNETDKSKIKKVYLSSNFKDQEIIQTIKKSNLKYVNTDPKVLDKMLPNNQGIIIEIYDYVYGTLDDITDDTFVVMLDHLEDPHNFGAIIRSCEAKGIKNIIIPKDRSVLVNETVMKTSTGAISRVNIIMVNNLVNAINKLKEKGITLRNRVVNDTDIWNIKEKVNDKSSITKRLELTFDNIDDAIKYLEEVKSINVNKLDILYNSTTLRESYLLQYLNSVFEISFDKVILNDSKNKSSLDMIECELKKGVPTDLYYLNKLIHGNFDNLIDCANSKSEMLTNKVKVKTR